MAPSTFLATHGLVKSLHIDDVLLGICLVSARVALEQVGHLLHFCILVLLPAPSSWALQDVFHMWMSWHVSRFQQAFSKQLAHTRTCGFWSSSEHVSRVM